MTRIALVNPNIAIKLISSGKTIIQTSGNGDLKGVIYNIYGKEIAENILDVEYQYEDINVKGVIGKPSISRSNRSNQLFFVNKRYIKDKTLTGSAEQAFKGMITIGKFGFLVLNLEINPQKVDVNVHPAKLEVRFEEESKVFKAVYHAIKDTLLKGDLVSNPEKEYTNNEKNEEENKGGLFQRKAENNKEEQKDNLIAQIYEQRTNNTNKETLQSSYESIIKKMSEMQKSVSAYKEGIGLKEDEVEYKADTQTEISNYSNSQSLQEKQIENKDEEFEQEKDKEVPEIEKTQIVDMQGIIEKSKQLENMKMYPEENFEEMYTSVFGTIPVKEEKVEEIKENVLEEAKVTTGEAISIFENGENDKYTPKYKFIGIAFSTYIIIELDKELYIIDQHAAHERIMYERIKENYYNNSQKDSQLMLLPDIITLTHKEMDIARENVEMFQKAGFTLEEFGENTIKLTGVPNVCIELDTKELFLETLDEINTVARTAKQEIEERFIATVACKAAVKANMALTKEEVDSLMEKLLKLPNPFTCPHGRPTAIRMSKTDIEKKFERRK
ncbi:MAG: hypothetical protein HFJ42_04520 [Clostridia bacterium]|nr:hypothetical protein [Clostridia bacterium]